MITDIALNHQFHRPFKSFKFLLHTPFNANYEKVKFANAIIITPYYFLVQPTSRTAEQPNQHNKWHHSSVSKIRIRCGFGGEWDRQHTHTHQTSRPNCFGISQKESETESVMPPIDWPASLALGRFTGTYTHIFGFSPHRRVVHVRGIRHNQNSCRLFNIHKFIQSACSFVVEL